MDPSPRPTKRARKSCERCRTRKQKCHGFPVCVNCQRARENCIQPASAIEEYESGPNHALLERIAFLEGRLAEYANAPPSPNSGDGREHYNHGYYSTSPPSSQGDRRSSIADVVGFISLGGEPAYVGSSSGFAMATNLGQMAGATVWNKALASAVSRTSSSCPSPISELRKHGAGPPNDMMGSRIVSAYFTRLHLRYPFLDRRSILSLHADRFTQLTSPPTPSDQYNTFKLYMIYAIGSNFLKLTEPYEYTPPENFFMTALQYISGARESHSVHNVEAMTLLVLYNLRSPSNSGIWYMIGLAMRTCVDLGMHREAYYSAISPYESQLRRRLFWTVYFLERTIAVSVGRPYSIADRDIDIDLPLEIDDSVHSDVLIERIMKVSTSPTFQEAKPSSNITLGVQCVRLKRLESHIQNTVYRVDKPMGELVQEVNGCMRMLEDWHSELPDKRSEYERDYLDMHYWKAVRLLLQPFLGIFETSDDRITLCLRASGEICQIFKRLHQRDSYGHSFIALHSVFIAGITMCYCLFLSPNLWSIKISSDLSACSSALFLMAERTPVVKKYRDALETIINATMEFLSPPTPSLAYQSQFPLSPQMTRHDLGGDTLWDSKDQDFVEHKQGIKRKRERRWTDGDGREGGDKKIKAEDARRQGRIGELGQMDAEWLLSLCGQGEGDERDGEEFRLGMLGEMMRFEC